MFNFILSDLQKAEGYFSENSDGRLSKALPDLSVVYGLYARLYMWEAGYQEETTGDKSLYATAAEYARKAITQSGCTPLNEAEWTNTATGFNDMSSNSWMWGMQYMKEDRVVTIGIPQLDFMDVKRDRLRLCHSRCVRHDRCFALQQHQ